jgi:hypothetical protein
VIVDLDPKVERTFGHPTGPGDLASQPRAQGDRVRAFNGEGRPGRSFSTGEEVLGSPLAAVQKDLSNLGP